MWRFREVEVDPARREVRRDGTVVHLEPQAFDLLAWLIEHRDRVVSKADLLDGVWGHRFVSEANLTTRVKEIRRAVGDDGKRQHTIQNVRGRGYRFVADVHLVDELSSRAEGPGLVGRDAALDAVRVALEQSRLVTITGPGGVGKSTLARVVATNTAGSRADGVHIVELVALDVDAQVVSAVTHALDIVLDNERTDDAIRSIATLDALLVLDNCEHVIDQAGALVESLLRVSGAPLQILATSQAPLGVSGEHLVDLPPLSPQEASELFAARARAALPSWGDNVSADRIDRLVAGLDRLPLAIEMAAARVRSMTFDDLERVIADQRGLLQVTHRTPAPRHRSLESLVTWSARLLEADQQEVFTGFSVFAGGVTASDAGAVLAPDDPGSVAPNLISLAERSLLVADVTGREARYSMLSTVRAVASRWLERSGAEEKARARHAEHVCSVLRDIDEMLRTPKEADGRRRLDELVDETRSAYRWATRHHAELATEMSAALFHAAYSSPWLEPAEWSSALLAQHPGNPLHFAGAVLMAAGAAAHRGDLGYAREQANTVVASTCGRLRAIAFELLADVALYEHDFDGAVRAARELQRLGDELADPHAAAFAVVDEALALADVGEPLRAIRVLDGKRLDEAAPTDRAWLAFARGAASSVLRDPNATDAFREAISIGSSVGNHFVVSVSRVRLAAEHARVGEPQLSLDSLATAFGDFLRHGNHLHAVPAIRLLVELLEAIGDDRGATILAGAVSEYHRGHNRGVEADQISETLAAVKTRVGISRFESWFDEGRALGPDHVRVAASLVDQHRR